MDAHSARLPQPVRSHDLRAFPGPPVGNMAALEFQCPLKLNMNAQYVQLFPLW